MQKKKMTIEKMHLPKLKTFYLSAVNKSFLTCLKGNREVQVSFL